jgi:hypothetical protein
VWGDSRGTQRTAAYARDDESKAQSPALTSTTSRLSLTCYSVAAWRARRAPARFVDPVAAEMAAALLDTRPHLAGYPEAVAAFSGKLPSTARIAPRICRLCPFSSVWNPAGGATQMGTEPRSIRTPATRTETCSGGSDGASASHEACHGTVTVGGFGVVSRRRKVDSSAYVCSGQSSGNKWPHSDSTWCSALGSRVTNRSMSRTGK